MKMAKKLFLVIVLGFVLFSTPVCAASELNMEDGMWEVTSTVKMQGMTIPPMSFSQCMTKEDAVPQDNSPGQENCKISDMKTVGSTVSWTMSCSAQGGDMTGKGKITYHGDRFEGEVSVEYPATGIVMVTEMTGRRTGPCQ
jgi:Protein of unknown function (DUF3617)